MPTTVGLNTAVVDKETLLGVATSTPRLNNDFAARRKVRLGTEANCHADEKLTAILGLAGGAIHRRFPYLFCA